MSTKSKKNAGEIREALQEIEERKQEIRERRAAIKGAGAPGPSRLTSVPSGPTYGRVPDPLAGAGPEWRETVMEGTPEDVQELRAEWERLEAEWHQLDTRETVLKRELKEAEEREGQERAEEELPELQEQLDEVTAALEEATEAYESARSEALGLLRRATNHRNLLDDESPFATPAQLHRIGMLLRKSLVERKTWKLGRADGRTVERPAIFYSPEEALRFMDLLGTPEPSLWDKLLDRWITSRDKKSGREEARERKLRTALRQERLRALAEGRIEDVEDGIEVAKATLASERPSGSRRIHESKESWVTSRRRS